MKAVLVVVCAVVTASFAFHQGSSAAACSRSGRVMLSEFDAIVEGRITDWEIIADATRVDPLSGEYPVNDPNFYGPYEPLRFHMLVERTYSGTTSDPVTMVAGNTARSNAGVMSWVGSSGACGAFDEDPTDKWVILGLYEDQFGRYYPSIFGSFFIGPEAEGPEYQEAVAELASELPADGGPPAQEQENDDEEEHKDVPWVPIVILAIIVPLAVLLVPAFLLGGKGSSRGSEE
jgi:hypothetical protein